MGTQGRLVMHVQLENTRLARVQHLALIAPLVIIAMEARQAPLNLLAAQDGGVRQVKRLQLATVYAPLDISAPCRQRLLRMPRVLPVDGE